MSRIDPIKIKELLLAAGAFEVGSSDDPQSLYDFKVSSRHRIHLAFDKLLDEAKLVTLSLVTIDREYQKDGNVHTSIDADRIGQWSVEDIVAFLSQNQSFISDLFPLRMPPQLPLN